MSTRDSDSAVLLEVGERLAKHRLRRDLTQAALANEAGVSKRTLERLEAGHSVQLASFVRVLRALDLLDVLGELPPVGQTPMQRLRQGEQGRQRASGGRGGVAPEPGWTWDDDT